MNCRPSVVLVILFQAMSMDVAFVMLS